MYIYCLCLWYFYIAHKAIFEGELKKVLSFAVTINLQDKSEIRNFVYYEIISKTIKKNILGSIIFLNISNLMRSS